MPKTDKVLIDVSSYIVTTAALTAEQHGAMLLLWMHRAAVGTLPSSDRERARIARVTTRRFSEKIWPAISPLFDAKMMVEDTSSVEPPVSAAA